MAYPRSREWARLGVLGLVASWLLHPFATNRLIGAGDAYWYSNMLADFVTQLRAGVFPVFVGQTEYAFNGAVYPLRVAPLFQHLAGLIDLLTGHSLGFFTLQNLTVIVCGVAGIYSAYFILCRIAPERRWNAAGLSILYLSCPGILAAVYTQDQYMTWMTVPIAPWATYGIVRTFGKDDLVSETCLVAPLAALWWAHAPIALWFTFVALASQIIRLGFVHRGRGPLLRALVGAVLFIILAQYPLVSLAELKTLGQQSPVVGALAHREMIVDVIRSSFPADLLPLSHNAGSLSNLQLGYGLWAILAVAAAVAIAARSRLLGVLVSSAAMLLVLVLPVPGVTAFLWSHFPESIVRITYYWPMQRFYLITAALLAAAGQIVIASDSARKGAVRFAACAVLLAGCAWSLWESRQFMRAGVARTASIESSSRMQRPENRPLMNHAYGLFPSLPSRFSNGVVDPEFEARFLDPGSQEPLPTPERQRVASGTFEVSIDTNPGILDLNPRLRLEPGRHYELRFAFPQTELKGVLQFVGKTFFREYALPNSGEPASFGSGPANSRSVGLWSTDPSGDTVTVRFIPMMTDVRPADLKYFGSFELHEIDPAQEPVRLKSLLPYQVEVTAPTASLLETHRMFIPGYRATIDGRPAEVQVSAEGLAVIPIASGKHTVSLSFLGPLPLRISYWLAIASWSALLLGAGYQGFWPRN